MVAVLDYPPSNTRNHHPRARRELGSGRPRSILRAKLPPSFAPVLPRGTALHADEAGSWYNLHERFEGKRINHQEAYSLDGACTNWAEEYFSRLRRVEVGIHHHIAGAHLLRYAQESSWREDNRRVSNGEQVNRIAALAMKCGKSVDFTGYWQRHLGDRVGAGCQLG
jgi:ISXO2-like transposase domain